MSGRTKAAAAARDADILDRLTRCAREGRPCPTNAELAVVLGVEGTTGACNALKRLEQSGLIKVERFAVHRIVTIVATGERTAGKPGKPHWRDRDAATVTQKKAQTNAAKAIATPALAPKPEPVRVDREPCTWCGVRADVGCKHNRAIRAASSVHSHTHIAAH